MKKILFTLITFITLNGNVFARNNRENLSWKRNVYQIGKCQYNTREHILILSGTNIKFDRCKIISGEWISLYNDRIVLTSPKEIQIDHILPWSWIYKHGANKLSLAMQMEIYNDYDNLAIASATENRIKSNHLVAPFPVYDRYVGHPPYNDNRYTRTYTYENIQCDVCNKWNLDKCSEVC